MSLKLGQLVGGHSFGSAPSLISAFLVDAISFGSKVLWVVWCHYLSTRVSAWPQEAAFPGSISPMLQLIANGIPVIIKYFLYPGSQYQPGLPAGSREGI